MVPPATEDTAPTSTMGKADNISCVPVNYKILFEKGLSDCVDMFDDDMI